ncbi:MAG: tRNA 2-selenouridine(34) synthase MnmH [Cyclobacteriaceae bacterium]|nr:tRNA 2-selenouridine(34) synthase MnmH [Cyclobacteriaceae bacterium]
MEYLETVPFLTRNVEIPMIDVRSPAEFALGHIPRAFNIPIFSDEERSSVGTIYKQSGREDAIEKGLEFVGPKLKDLALQAKKLAYQQELKVYCWRGGMRSEKMSWLFELVGIRCFVLKGGIKAYRQQLLKDFEQIKKLIILQGSTGTGKTEILRRMQEMGEQVIDLERAANHRGSAFGDIGFGEQPTSQQFQNDLHEALVRMDPDKRIWVESESLTIGKVYLPETLWEKMNRSILMELEIPRKKRIERLVTEYGNFDRNILIDKTLKIQKRFGGNNVKRVVGLIEAGELTLAADLLLKYYDKSYRFSQEKYKGITPIIINSNWGDAAENAGLIIMKANEFSL